MNEPRYTERDFNAAYSFGVVIGSIVASERGWAMTFVLALLCGAASMLISEVLDRIKRRGVYANRP